MFQTLSQPICLMLYILLVGYAIYPIKKQLTISKIQHLVFGSAAALTVLWWFRTGIYDGLEVHFLWMSAASMVLGWRWAIFSATIALIVMAAIGAEDWRDIGVVGLFGCALPALTTFAIYAYSYHKLPKNFFIYVFVCGFFAGAIGITLKMVGLAGLYWLDGSYSWRILQDNYLVLIPLLLFPEGLLNGMTLSLMAMYKPDWVATFYDKQYFDEQ